jgi:hypothetical protein
MASLNGLLYYYTFDGTSPLTNLITGTDLTLVGSGVAPSTTKFKTGSKSIYNSAASNTGNYNAAINGSTAFSGNACTISLWFNPENTNASGRLIRLSNAALGVCAGISLYVSGTNVGISYDISGIQSTFSSTSSDKFGISANTWIHVAITYSMPVAGTTYIGVYLNGTMIQNPTTSTTYSFLGSTLANLYLFGSGTPQPMAGYIDEVMVFNRALSTTEVMNLYNFNYLNAGQTTLFQSTYGSSTTAVNAFVASGGISTTGTITTNNNNINAGLGTINAGSLNLVSTADPTTSGGFTSTIGSTGSVNCGAITTNNNSINAGTGGLTCGLVYCGAINTSNSNYIVVSAGTKLTQLKSISDFLPYDYAVIGNTLYIFKSMGNRLDTFDATAFQSINENFIPGITGRSMDSYGSNLYITASTSIKIYDSVTGANTSNISVGYIVWGLFIYNGIIYVGTQGTNVPPIIAYNTNGTLLSGFSTSNLSSCHIISITVANNIIYAGDINNNRVSTFNATTGATINLNFMTVADPYGIAISRSTLFVNSNAYNLSTGALIASSVISSTYYRIKVIGTRLYASTYDGGYFSNIYSLTEFGSINAGTGTVTCSTITSTTNTITTNNSSINAGTGSLTCGSITTNNNAINAGSGSLTCGSITSTGIVALKCAGVPTPAVMSTYPSTGLGTLIVGSNWTASAAGGSVGQAEIDYINIKPSTQGGHSFLNLNYGSQSFEWAPISCGAITTNNYPINAGSGSLTCGRIYGQTPRFALENLDTAGSGIASLGLAQGAARLDIGWNWRGGIQEITYINNCGAGHLFLGYYSIPVPFQPPRLVLTYSPVTASAFNIASDRKLKRDIMKVLPSLENILKLNPVTFNYIHDASDAQVHSGFVAQDLEEVFPNCVSTNQSEDINKTINILELVPYIVKSIQEQHDIVVSQQTQITELQTTVSSQQSQIDSLTQQLAELKALVQTLIPSP